tara:strand:+ start:1629 stop:2528 length:900 start_codon:yes stop_codon:yes gene_type:complete
MTTVIDERYKREWDDYVVKDTTNYETSLDVTNLNASEQARTVALGFFRNYSGFDQTAYGEGNYTTGLTEQQAHDLWKESFNNQQALAKKQIINSGITTIPACVYDALILFHWTTGKIANVSQGDTRYNLLEVIRLADYSTAADMIINSTVNKQLCVKVATILRLADYGKYKTRKWYRANGIFKIRDFNEKGVLNNDQLRRARFAYYAETKKFLPMTPEGLRRQIVKEYEATLVNKTFTYSGTNTFKLEKIASVTPIQKLEVVVNDAVLQHEYDWTVSNFTLTISKSLNTGDIIQTTIKI